MWAVFWGPGDPRNGAGRVHGAQTAQRGELSGGVEAARQRQGLLEIASDSRYLVLGIRRLGLGHCLRDELHGDLWEELRLAGGGTEVTARWVPAHRARPDPPLLSVEDWAGNAAADALATEELRRLRAEAGNRLARVRELRLVLGAQAVIAACQEAVLRRDHAYEGGSPALPGVALPGAALGCLPLGCCPRRPWRPTPPRCLTRPRPCRLPTPALGPPPVSPWTRGKTPARPRMACTTWRPPGAGSAVGPASGKCRRPASPPSPSRAAPWAPPLCGRSPCARLCSAPAGPRAPAVARSSPGPRPPGSRGAAAALAAWLSPPAPSTGARASAP